MIKRETGGGAGLASRPTTTQNWAWALGALSVSGAQDQSMVREFRNSDGVCFKHCNVCISLKQNAECVFTPTE